MRYKVKFIVRQITIEAPTEDAALESAWAQVVDEPRKRAKARITPAGA